MYQIVPETVIVSLRQTICSSLPIELSSQFTEMESVSSNTRTTPLRSSVVAATVFTRNLKQVVVDGNSELHSIQALEKSSSVKLLLIWITITVKMRNSLLIQTGARQSSIL